MDVEVCNLLRVWGLESYINLFRENTITYTSMMLLDAAEINALFPFMGHRVIFTQNLGELRKTMHPNILTSGIQEIYIEYNQDQGDTYLLTNDYEDGDSYLFY